MPQPTDDHVRRRAHQWEIAGRPVGRDDGFWHEAKRKVTHGANDNPDEKSKAFLE